MSWSPTQYSKFEAERSPPGQRPGRPDPNKMVAILTEQLSIAMASDRGSTATARNGAISRVNCSRPRTAQASGIRPWRWP